MTDDITPQPGLPAKSTADTIAEMLPGLFRVARFSAARTMQWAIDANRQTLRTVLDDIAKGEPPQNVIADATAVWREVTENAIGIGRAAIGRTPEPDPIDATAPPPRPKQPRPRASKPAGATAEELREMGGQLLRDSADVWYQQDVHPAFTRVLQELLPDEARILRFLYQNGPQPSVDVRTNRPMGRGSEKVASGLSMIGLYAGVRKAEDTSVELANLERLRLIWFSKEQVADPSVYQLLEAQPDVLEAMHRAGRSPKTEHRSIELTPFGLRFCETCLPMD
jgi:hypothetical protein